MHKLYEDAIDSGGHPNELAMKLALKTAVEAAIGVAKTVALISPDRFRIMSVDEEIDRLVGHSGAVFSRDAQLLRHAS